MSKFWKLQYLSLILLSQNINYQLKLDYQQYQQRDNLSKTKSPSHSKLRGIKGNSMLRSSSVETSSSGKFNQVQDKSAITKQVNASFGNNNAMSTSFYNTGSGKFNTQFQANKIYWLSELFNSGMIRCVVWLLLHNKVEVRQLSQEVS